MYRRRVLFAFASSLLAFAIAADASSSPLDVDVPHGASRRHRTHPLRSFGRAFDPALARAADHHRRRRLLGDGDASPASADHPYATAPLHGSVKEHGYYYADVDLGTPPRRFQLIVDTGSTLTYVPCVDCGAACGAHTGADPFDPDASTTCAPVRCNTADCHTGGCDASTGADACAYARNYAERSSVRGRLMKDVIHLGGHLGDVEIVFGCTTRESGSIHEQEADGLMGLGNGENSLPIQLAATGASDRAFSLCYGSFEGGGAVTFGRLPTDADAVPALAYTPLKPNPRHPAYYVVATERWVLGDSEVAASSAFSEGYGTVLDSGTTFTYVPTAVFRAFIARLDEQVVGGLTRVEGPDPSYPQDVCYGASAGTAPSPTLDSLENFFPTLTVAFEGGASLALPPANYLFIHGKIAGAFCVGVMDNGRAGTLIGGVTVRDVVVEYDMEEGDGRVGFAVADCEAVLARLAGGEHADGPAGGPAEGPEGGPGGEGDEDDDRAHARREGSGGKENGDDGDGASGDGASGDEAPPPPAAAAAADSSSGAPAGFVVFLFAVAATAGGLFHYRRVNDGRFPTPPPGTGDAVRAVVAKGREAAARGNDMFRAKWHELKEKVGRASAPRYARFGLDDDRPRHGVELPPLIAKR